MANKIAASLAKMSPKERAEAKARMAETSEAFLDKAQRSRARKTPRKSTRNAKRKAPRR